nr:unnamed protein product [Callosobruchus chinensis]
MQSEDASVSHTVQKCLRVPYKDCKTRWHTRPLCWHSTFTSNQHIRILDTILQLRRGEEVHEEYDGSAILSKHEQFVLWYGGVSVVVFLIFDNLPHGVGEG